ncbi:MAG: nucleoside monophosphate kinase [Candidatus Nomurabacteria bacterium]|nr:nucleoside monophosphate kinase [Candidatus Nomurabacteria bacterium]
MKKERLGFNLAIMGVWTSGKDTQANLLKEKYNLQPVGTGLYTRNLLKEKSSDGDWARRTAGKGKALPMFLMKKFLIKQIKNKSKNKDLIFIGGPRLKPEAQLVRKLLKENNQNIFVICITLPEKEVQKRSLLRMADKNIKEVYKILDAKNILKERIKVHNTQVSKTIKYFDDLKILKKINGNQTIEKVHEDIEKAILYFKKLNK